MSDMPMRPPTDPASAERFASKDSARPGRTSRRSSASSCSEATPEGIVVQATGSAGRVQPQTRVFQALTISALRVMVSRLATDAGLDEGRKRDLVLAVCEVATNSVRHAKGRGLLRVWQERNELVCEVADRGRATRPLLGGRRPGPDEEGGYGLWIAGQLCDRIEVRQRQWGTAVRLYMTLASA